MTRPVGPLHAIAPLAPIASTGPFTALPTLTGLAGAAHPPFPHDAALQRHLAQCARARGRWFGLAVLAERLHGLVLPRLATTAALSALTLGLFAHWL